MSSLGFCSDFVPKASRRRGKTWSSSVPSLLGVPPIMSMRSYRLRLTGKGTVASCGGERILSGRRTAWAPALISQGAAAAGAGGAGPGLCSDGERPRCARIFRMTAGSCSVAISQPGPKSRPHEAQWYYPTDGPFT